MRRRLEILAVVLAPLVVLAAMVLTDRLMGRSGRGYDYVVRLELPPPAGEIGLPPVQGPADASRPLVVIDAGHGGHDPGAGQGIKEKDLTLALARSLRDRLLEEGGIRVAMTRDDDRYLLLPERSGIARRLKADLFVSIHADSSASGGEASGASIYTLSAKGTTEAAARMAERENTADQLNGMALADANDAVSAILVDLSQRETQSRSDDFARLLLREGQDGISFREGPLQSAAFAVLKAPDVPSVLFESGYISNSGDTARLLSPEGRKAFADATARAIRVYFARQSTQ